MSLFGLGQKKPGDFESLLFSDKHSFVVSCCRVALAALETFSNELWSRVKRCGSV